MQYKPFPPEKRAYILQKPFEEFEQFFQELSPTERNRLASDCLLFLVVVFAR